VTDAGAALTGQRDMHGQLRRPMVVLALLCASQLMVILDGSIVAVALPVIGADLHVAGAELAWVVNAYLVPFGGVLLLAGRLGDVLGPRRILLAGLALFTVASLGCGLAPTIGLLIAARLVQGIGGALASAVVLGMIVTLFAGPTQRGRALAVYGFVGAAGSSIGLLAGGLLTQALSWPWIFLINVPIGLAAVAGVRWVVPHPAAAGGRVDVVGAVLATAGLAAVVYALLSTTAGPGLLAVLAVLSVGLLIAFGVRQARARLPLLPLRLLTGRSTGLGNLVQALMVAGLFGFQFLGVLYLQQLLGYGPLRAGLAFLPVPIGIAAVSLILTARLIARLGPRRVLAAGLAFVTAGLTTLIGLPSHGGYATHVLPAGLLIAIGFGLAYPALAGIAVGSAPPHDAGIASGLFNTTQQIGGALGLAILTRVATSTLTAGHTTATLSGYHLAFATAAGFSAIAFLVSLRTAGTTARRAPPSDPPVRVPRGDPRARVPRGGIRRCSTLFGRLGREVQDEKHEACRGRPGPSR
jgi:EmrB/QacA subfamily drug resistance transporter